MSSSSPARKRAMDSVPAEAAPGQPDAGSTGGVDARSESGQIPGSPGDPNALPNALIPSPSPVMRATGVVLERFRNWVRFEGAWWAASFVFHMLLMAVLMLVPHTISNKVGNEAPTIEEVVADDVAPPPQLERFEVGATTEMPTDLTTEGLSLTKAPEIQAQTPAESVGVQGPDIEGGGFAGVTASGPTLGGLGSGFDIMGPGAGPARSGKGGIGVGPGFGDHPGVGGAGIGFSSRAILKKSLGSQGGTRQSDRCVAAALNWIARHQSRDGSWPLAEFPHQCKGAVCTGPGSYGLNGRFSGAAGTSLALLPFLAYGQTHESKGPYRKTIYDGLAWLMKNQQPSGDLSGAARPEQAQMYTHGLATITLCEAYGLTRNKKMRVAAQQAVNFIQNAQNASTGGWRYTPGEAGDTSVLGWQVMALKSAQMAGLQVNYHCLEGAQRFLKTCSRGNGGQFSYTPNEDSPGPSMSSRGTPSMTAVGMLCLQYMGMKRSDPQLAEGVGVLLKNMPDSEGKNPDIYYWYYATQVMHNASGPDWDNWNRRMRHVLINSQCKEGCAIGSWDPDKISTRLCAEAGGRLMATSLAALTLEVYYRYLPLYQLDKVDELKPLSAGPPSSASPQSPSTKPIVTPPKPAAPAAKPSPTPPVNADKMKKTPKPQK